MNIFRIPSRQKFLNRCIASVIVGQDFFFASFFWEGAVLIATQSLGWDYFDWKLCFLAGVGTALGLFFSQMITINLYLKLPPEEKIADIHRAVLVSFGAGFATGTLWQVSVNISNQYQYTFTEAFFFVYFMASVAFFVGVFVVREINELFIPLRKKLEIDNASLALWHDFLLALTVGAADAFFVGTDCSQFPGCWLSDFSVQGKPIIVALILAGLSSACGGLICQTIQNMILEDVWCDYLYFATSTSVSDFRQSVSITERTRLLQELDNEQGV